MVSKRRESTVTDPCRRVILYARVSGLKQEFDGTSLDTQIAAMTEYAEARGWQIVDAVRETWTGFELWQRKKLSAIRDRLIAKEADTLVCYDLDRLSRSQTHAAMLWGEARDHGYRLAFVTQEFEQTATGQFIMSAYAFAAELEREKIKERTWRAIKAQAKDGRRLSGCRALYGYQYADAQKSRLIEDAVSAAVVRRIYAEAARGVAIRAIARGLNDDGIPSPMAYANPARVGVGKFRGEWSPQAVHWILHDRTYTGDAVAFKYETSKTVEDRADGTKDNIVRVHYRDEGDTIALPTGTVPAIIDPATFAAVQARLTRSKEQASRNTYDPESTLLRSFAYCGYCRSKRLRVAKTKAGSPYYRCQDPSIEGCPHFGMTAHTLDRLVWRRIEYALHDSDTLFADLERQIGADSESAQAVASLTRQRDRLVREQAEWSRQIARMVADAGDTELAEMTTAPMRAELLRAAKAIRELDGQIEARQQQTEQRAALTERIRAMRAQLGVRTATLENMTFAQRRDVLDWLNVRVYVYASDHSPRVEMTAAIDLEALAWLDAEPTYDALTDSTVIDLSRVEFPRGLCSESGTGSSLEIPRAPSPRSWTMRSSARSSPRRMP